MILRTKILIGCLVAAGVLGMVQIAQCTRSKAQRTAVSTHVELRRAEARIDRPAIEVEARAEATDRIVSLSRTVRRAIPAPVQSSEEVSHDLVDLADRINSALGISE